MTVPRNSIHSIAVFCGSNFGRVDAYRNAARETGAEIARRGWQLVYGGTDKGLMGVVADAVLANGGKAHGVITQALSVRGQQHAGLTSSEIVGDMRTRKARMADLADAFVALPGGFGTLEELLEIATLAQLGEHRKPFGLLDVLDFYRPLREMFGHAVDEGFMKIEHARMPVFDSRPAPLLDALEVWRAPTVTKWIGQPNA
ncbi:TIGR00730 family Rossman fold protein [Pararobbsia silviterrae]|uniref:Cytokinin riboside 5'-monophosphate phosphoribohydrolase n=1 Tax=Pararobbsia silviterrae TaxID=1792498 RepID=A0A494Y929_9BURK|nr:TIGR00730 family Rossman fold protein [Pararobbsia silviterrae]RKP58856.1 TIGR00730 family Rossman fold protein [Pararobbsia silviterrae]